MIKVDLNCDMGEGMSTDELIMPYISSANIACGFHAGDSETMIRTIKLAQKHKVSIGAHPSFPDRKNFGRIPMNLSSHELYEIITQQLNSINENCKTVGAKLCHVKPHGALYNMAAIDKDISLTIAKAIKDFDSTLTFYGLANSIMIDVASSSGLKVKHEVFADRTYQDNGTLTPRSQANALITDDESCIRQVMKMIQEGYVLSTTNNKVNITADTICLHGDGDHAIPFAKLIHAKLVEMNINITSE